MNIMELNVPKLLRFLSFTSLLLMSFNANAFFIEFGEKLYPTGYEVEIDGEVKYLQVKTEGLYILRIFGVFSVAKQYALTNEINTDKYYAVDLLDYTVLVKDGLLPKELPSTPSLTAGAILHGYFLWIALLSYFFIKYKYRGYMDKKIADSVLKTSCLIYTKQGGIDEGKIESMANSYRMNTRKGKAKTYVMQAVKEIEDGQCLHSLGQSYKSEFGPSQRIRIVRSLVMGLIEKPKEQKTLLLELHLFSSGLGLSDGDFKSCISIFPEIETVFE